MKRLAFPVVETETLGRNGIVARHSHYSHDRFLVSVVLGNLETGAHGAPKGGQKRDNSPERAMRVAHGDVDG